MVVWGVDPEPLHKANNYLDSQILHLKWIIHPNIHSWQTQKSDCMHLIQSKKPDEEYG